MREEGEGHRVLVLLIVPDPEEELPHGLGVVGGRDDGVGTRGNLVAAHHLLVVPTRGTKIVSVLLNYTDSEN